MIDIDIVLRVLTLVVGTGAFWIYRAGKSNEKRNAAIIIVMDIRHVEQIRGQLLKAINRNVIDHSMPDILPENNWSKYRHMFSSDLSYDDFIIMNDFFQCAAEISEAKARLEDAFYSNIKEKSSVIQNKIADVENVDEEERQKKRAEIIRRIENDTYAFTPSEPRYRIAEKLNALQPISSSVVFEKIKKKAKLR